MMTTRTIVTSHPDVACDVCERRLLRGEQHDVFIAAGRRRVVCELCAPRAVHEGWMRESEAQSVSLPPTRPRRGRSLLERMRQARAASAGRGRTAQESEPDAADPFDLLGAGAAAPVPAGREQPARAQAEEAEQDPVAPAQAGAVPPAASSPEQAALPIFNASEHPRRVAGVARSLGPPAVSVRSAEHAASVVRIVVAWELCWYRYEVDLDELDAAVRVAGQGTELEELEREERVANAQADDSGRLSQASG